MRGGGEHWQKDFVVLKKGDDLSSTALPWSFQYSGGVQGALKDRNTSSGRTGLVSEPPTTPFPVGRTETLQWGESHRVSPTGCVYYFSLLCRRENPVPLTQMPVVQIFGDLWSLPIKSSWPPYKWCNYLINQHLLNTSAFKVLGLYTQMIAKENCDMTSKSSWKCAFSMHIWKTLHVASLKKQVFKRLSKVNCICLPTDPSLCSVLKIIP